MQCALLGYHMQKIWSFKDLLVDDLEPTYIGLISIQSGFVCFDFNCNVRHIISCSLFSFLNTLEHYIQNFESFLDSQNNIVHLDAKNEL